MKPKVRFAPSPTGYLHVGNVRTALVNWLFARAGGGVFLLRIDDTDAERSKVEFETEIREDLRWLGLTWDEEARQSDRFERYREAMAKLQVMGRLYPCYETSEELDIKRKMQASRGQPPIYDRAALRLTEEQKRAFEVEGRKPHYRFLLEAKDTGWQDGIRGEVKFHGSHLSDPVLVREDGVPIYMFASVVDDGDMGITDIIRGEDHVSNTAVQIQLFEALGFALPRFSHLALLKTKDGELSKRTGGGDIRSLRQAGIEPMAITSLLGKIGTSDPVEIAMDMEALVQHFALQKFGRAPAIYDAEELKRLNAKWLAMQAFAAVQNKLAALGMKDISEDFWLSVRGNITALPEVKAWWEMLHQPLTPVISDAEFTKQAADLLPEGAWAENVWNDWLNALKQATGRKGKELFMPLRLALTGREDGPELKPLLLMLGREKARKRLMGEMV